MFCRIVNNPQGEQRGHYCTVSGIFLLTEHPSNYLKDIGTRLFICRVYISGIFASLLAGGWSFFKDLSEINKAQDVLELCPLIDENIASNEISSDDICGINDLNILLLLVRENFADTKVTKTMKFVNNLDLLKFLRR